MTTPPNLPNRRITFRDEDLWAADKHILGCFQLNEHDFIQRACNQFCKNNKLNPFNIFIMPNEAEDKMYITFSGSRLWDLPSWSIIMSAGSLKHYRGLNQASNFAHEFGHALTYDSDEFKADAKAGTFLGNDTILSWLNFMTTIHGHTQNGKGPSLQDRIEVLSHANIDEARKAA
ncbi:MAG: hypothetical protein WAZ18_07365 [Alphaproteobacteria bacterium]